MTSVICSEFQVLCVAFSYQVSVILTINTVIELLLLMTKAYYISIVQIIFNFGPLRSRNIF